MSSGSELPAHSLLSAASVGTKAIQPREYFRINAFTLLVDCLAWATAAVAAANCLYLLLLTLCSWRPGNPPASSRVLKFIVLVPAHNESEVIGRTIKSLTLIDWPVNQFVVVVVADNCTDDTAVIAHAAGASVVERSDTNLRGKGYALARGFDHVRSEHPQAEAILVVDADSTVSANVLAACAARLERGAEAVQLHYGVLNVFDSWRSRLMTIAMASFHEVRSEARARLGLSCGIRGNGWCVRTRVLDRVPYRAFSLVEDVEFGLDLGLAGIRVDYAGEASVLGEMVSDEASAATQRQRWEMGRMELVRRRTWPLLTAAVQRRSWICFDLAMDLLVLPLSIVVLIAMASVGLAALHAWLVGAMTWNLWIAVGSISGLAIYVLRGWQLSGVGLQGVFDLAHVPGFIFWKVRLLLKGRRPRSWIRTNRGRL